MNGTMKGSAKIISVIAVIAIILCLTVNILVIRGKADSSRTVNDTAPAETVRLSVSPTDQPARVTQVSASDLTPTEAKEPYFTESKREWRRTLPKLMYPEYPYFIEVDKTHEIVTIYTTGFSGKYDKIVRQMLCSTSQDPDKFPDGYWKLKEDRCSAKNVWRKMKSHGKDLYAQYATQITGDFLFHSVPCTAMKKDTLDVNRYNKLGTADSGGCVRLSVENAKWICENCAAGTTVHLISKEADPELEALAAELKAALPAVDSSGWEPSDPDPKNPNYHPQFTEPDPEPEGYLVENFEKITYSKEIPYVS